jgi:Zn-dependent protease
VGAPWPAGPPRGPRNRVDPRWLVLIVVGVIVVVILVRQHKIHISEPTVLYFLAIIPSIILHEVTHGWVALGFGDDTAKRAGRLSLNPLVHVSLFGTLILPALLVLSGYPPFGWAKPVPVNMSRMRHPRNDDVVVALAGPAMNIALAVALGLAFRFAVPGIDKASIYYYGLQSGVGQPVWAQYLFAIGYVNVILAVFNLIPIPPLDGASVLERLLPRQWLPGYLSIRQYTIFLPFLIIWIHPEWIDDIFQPFLNYWAHILGPVTVSST